ncbi:MAG: insulinase family protein [Anaerolineales bacterium]|nr:MAG: insulinase family protein [Anaerolineales bacterium]
MRGTSRRYFQELYDDLESVGAGLGFSGGTHTTGFNGKGLVEDLDLLLGILSEALSQPSFPKREVEKLRAQILTGLDLREQSTKDRAAMAFDEMVYAGHPYKRPDEGYPETVLSIRLKDLKAFHKKHYGPRGMVVTVVGGIDPDKAVDKVRAALGEWENDDQPPVPELPAWKPLEEKKTRRVEVSGKIQSDVVIGTAGPIRSAPEYLAAAVGNNILGQFGMMGRIGEAVRQKEGLAYYAYSSLSGSQGPGPWSVSAGVNPKNEEKAIELILTEVSRFITELVEEEELSDTQTNFIGRMPLSMESNAGVAASLLHMEKHNLGMDYFQRFPDLVRGITREDVLAAAANYLDPEHLAEAIAGPPKE